VHIQRIGFTPVKGGRHLRQDVASLAMTGPVGDRAFCLVNKARGQVLRTIENPSLLQVTARWGEGVLSVTFPDRTIEGIPSQGGERLTMDYWGRSAALQCVDGPWSQAYSDFLGLDVVLCRALTAGDVVYGASVTLATTSSTQLLERHLGHQVASERFRSTFLVDTGRSPAHVEDSWVGRELRIGGACVRVLGVVPRCAVIDLHPEEGRPDVRVLAELAAYRKSQAEITFGVDAEVIASGQVRPGDQVALLDG